jgi:hypothetical protein
MSLNAGDGGVAVAQITLGDRTPYLTFDIMDSNDKCTVSSIYLFPIRIRVSEILNYGSGSGRPIIRDPGGSGS